MFAELSERFGGKVTFSRVAVVEKLAGAAVAAELFEANPAAIIQTDSIQPTAMPDPSATSLN
jgi:hypothetical protein